MQSLTGELKPTEQRLEQCCTFLLPGLPFPGWCGQDSALLCAFPSPASARGIYFSGVSPSGQPCWLSLLLPGWPMRLCWTDWNHPELMQLPQVNDDFHSLLTHLRNYQETVFPSVHVLKPAGVSPVFYSDPKEHSRTEKYTLKRNTRNPRPHPTQKYPERVCHVQTVNPTPNTNQVTGKAQPSRAGFCQVWQSCCADCSAQPQRQQGGTSSQGWSEQSTAPSDPQLPGALSHVCSQGLHGLPFPSEVCERW